jgi:hypothetical protein
MKKGKLKDLSLYNINVYSTTYNEKKKATNYINNNTNNSSLNKFKLECVIGKGGFGKVSYIN